MESNLVNLTLASEKWLAEQRNSNEAYVCRKRIWKQEEYPVCFPAVIATPELPSL